MFFGERTFKDLPLDVPMVFYNASDGLAQCVEKYQKRFKVKPVTGFTDKQYIYLICPEGFDGYKKIARNGTN